jgi:hypothetical protein
MSEYSAFGARTVSNSTIRQSLIVIGMDASLSSVSTDLAHWQWRWPRAQIKSQTKSQRPQTGGVTRPRPATIVAARCRIRPRQAMFGDGTDSPYKRGVRRFKSYCAHFFEYPSVCLGGSRGAGQVGDISCRCEARTVRCVDAASENHMCSHLWWVPREMRHTFVSLLSANGTALEDIADLVGHRGAAPVSGPREAEPVPSDPCGRHVKRHAWFCTGRRIPGRS